MIIITGDLYLGNKSIKLAKNLIDKININDYLISNLECVLEDSDLVARIDKNSILTFDSDSFHNYLSQINAKTLFTLGNNHIHDLGEKGLRNTKNLLKKNKIEHFGADSYLNILKPYIIGINGNRIAFLCVSTNSPEVGSISSKDDFQGILNYNDENIIKKIKIIKRSVDYLILLPHWGREHIDYPSLEQRNLAHKWIENGVDLVIGSHPHVIQGKEKYKNKWIYYSLGNFIFPDFFTKSGIQKKWHKRNNHGILLDINFDDSVVIKEIGTLYNQSNNKLIVSEQSIKMLNRKSEILNKKDLSTKDYFIFWENNYIKKIIEQKNKSLIVRLLPKHKHYSRLGFLFRRLLSKLGVK